MKMRFVRASESGFCDRTDSLRQGRRDTLKENNCNFYVYILIFSKFTFKFYSMPFVYIYSKTGVATNLDFGSYRSMKLLKSEL